MKKRPKKFGSRFFISLKKKEFEEAGYGENFKKSSPWPIGKNWKNPDIYVVHPGEQIKDLFMGIGLVALLAWFFYRSLAAFILLLPLAEVYRKLRGKERKRRLFEQMERQFMDALTALAGALKAGYSVDHALTETWREMTLLYGENALISREFGRMQSRLEMNRRPEEVFVEFAERSRLEDAEVFAEVFAVAGRSGGDLILVISRTTEMIGEKLRAEQEIRTAIRARQFEQKIMNGMPLGILGYMEVVSSGYLSPVYGTVSGVLIMSLGLVLYGAAYLLGKKLTEIEV